MTKIAGSIEGAGAGAGSGSNQKSHESATMLLTF
jgi:hypothetical protein